MLAESVQKEHQWYQQYVDLFFLYQLEKWQICPPAYELALMPSHNQFAP